MPIYVLKCPQCESTQEVMCKYEEINNFSCEQCQTKPLENTVQQYGFSWGCECPTSSGGKMTKK